jgi:3-deoxy-7-phosphoheptulonate synthase
MTEGSNRTVVESRSVVSDILARRDPRLLAIVGPCSIHNEDSALEYAGLLSELRARLKDRIFVVMRVYFEKPRTTIGWRGFIIDPHLDGSYDIAAGLYKARRLLKKITEMGLPAATEMLDPIVPQYIDDLVTWSAIGARTTESQTHRDMASGLSMPVGFKNNTDGNIQTAIDGMTATMGPHSFLGMDENGTTCVVSTSGNPNSHIILRGGRSGGNFDTRALQQAAGLLETAGFPPVFVVDCSHGNSGKNHKRQEIVLQSILESRRNGFKGIQGFMIESNIGEGNQKLSSDPSSLEYGVSITDECVGWDKTVELLQYAYDQMF